MVPIPISAGRKQTREEKKKKKKKCEEMRISAERSGGLHKGRRMQEGPFWSTQASGAVQLTALTTWSTWLVPPDRMRVGRRGAGAHAR